ncbi:adhesion G protein-coupled receptor F5-like isoform X2 [Brienomyrus brachyistius]|uniref:adhesion G protein-coupled receptor F5-like isoform X2 n=1 Tax=Brienomyrus brachyistius TaxID=42636 RepID=UPI0020B1E32F|nr:adhesion G protein-coupled receptor F5-like isoform X2 [Brienomyrus brachyistius]
MINDLRNLLATTSFPYPMSNTIEVTGVNLTTVCYPNGNGFQCRCEERFALSYDSCVLYTHCDEIIQGTCRCINAIPADGQFCQPQLPPKTELDYDIDIEVTVSDIAMINDLRNLLATTSFPYPMSNTIEVTGVNLTTVCYPNGNGFQCRCEERFALSYDSCVLYTHCDDIIQGTCRCINAIPADGQFCQPQLPPKTELDYDIDIEVTVSDIAMINDLRNLLATTSFPYPMSNTIEVTGVNLTTVCYPNGNGFQCRCEERFALSYDSCVLYTHCDEIIQGTCRCINAIPADGQFCQPQLLCYPNGNGFQCRCEERFALSYDSCVLYTHCDDIIQGTCRCINAIPADGQFCQPQLLCYPNGNGFQCRCEERFALSYDSCVLYTHCDDIIQGTCRCINAIPADGQFCEPQPPNTPKTELDYDIDIEVTVSDIAMINDLRNLLTTTSFPYPMTNTIEVTGVNLTTVCYPNGNGFQCRCEEWFYLSNDSCVLYTPCDDIIQGTCTCINAIPADGQFCEPQPPNTPKTELDYDIDIEVTVSDIAMINDLRNLLATTSFPYPLTNTIEVTGVNLTTVCYPNGNGFQCRCEEWFSLSNDSCVLYTPCDDIIQGTCTCINAIPADGQFCEPQPPNTPKTELDYDIDIEVTVSDIAVINDLRNLLATTSFPYPLTNTIEVTGVNLTTVCYPNGNGFQCRCEERFALSYDSCVLYTPCDDIIQGTCTCINAIPADGQFCQLQPPSTITTTTPTTSTSSPVTDITTPIGNTTAGPVTDITTPIGNTTAVSPTSSSQKPSPVTDITTPIGNTTAGRDRNITTTTAKTTAGRDRNITTTTAKTTAGPFRNITTTTVKTTAVSPPIQSSNTDFTVEMSFKILLPFDQDLANSSSSTFKKLKSPIEQILTEHYKTLNGFVAVYVLGFRSGSVITDFRVETNSVNSTEIAILDSKVAVALKTQGYSVDPISFSGVIQGNQPFIKNYDIIYPGTTLQLTCVVPETMQMETGSWSVNGLPVSNNAKYSITNSPPTLTVQGMSIDDNGIYKFTMTQSIFTFTRNESISVTDVVPPIIQLNKLAINVPCGANENIPLTCCVTYYLLKNVTATWMDGSVEISSVQTITNMLCVSVAYPVPKQCDTKQLTCQVMVRKASTTQTFTDDVTIAFFSGAPDCKDPTTYGLGKNGNTSTVSCPANFTGSSTAVCENGNWTLVEDNCVFSLIKTLELFSQSLSSANVSSFVHDLRTTTSSYTTIITQSPATISSIVSILEKIASVSQNISKTSMQDVLETVSVLVSPQTQQSWAALNSNNRTQNTSSALLESIENITHSLSSNSFTINTTNIELIKTTLTFPFNEAMNSSQIFIPSQGLPNNTSITTIVFTTLEFVLPARTTGNTMNNSINGVVMLAYVNETINNVSLTFDKTNKTKGNNQCVFWNFKVFNGIGGWDSTGCQLQSETNDSVTCSCNHLTSFSILMSPFVPESIEVALNYITYIGVSISMGCLVLCLIIEAFVWSVVTNNSTAHMRHVAIVNIALSLLIANIWFIIGAAVSNVGQSTPKNACSAATFFIHFFYLALFFWMLISALFLFYRTMMVFSHMSKRTMMAISFTVGYGAPLIIAIITIAVTAPKNGYFRQDDACWLNWYQTKALLAFVIPALIIVVVNLLILIVVLYKLLMRGVGENRQSEAKNALVVIARCVAVLTPIFGITWGLGIGTMVTPANPGVHIAFAVFNSLQGFFILVFGTLLDSKVRSAVVGRFSFLHSLSSRTRSTSAGPSLSSLAERFRRRRQTNYSNKRYTLTRRSFEKNKMFLLLILQQV